MKLHCIVHVKLIVLHTNVLIFFYLLSDDSIGKKVLIPVPVPIYVPCPVHMYSNPFPVPVPFPLPVPVPIFIPTTRNSAHGIMKEIKVSKTRAGVD